MLLSRLVQQRNTLCFWHNVKCPSFNIAVSNVLFGLKTFCVDIYLRERVHIDCLLTALPTKPNTNWIFLSYSYFCFIFQSDDWQDLPNIFHSFCFSADTGINVYWFTCLRNDGVSSVCLPIPVLTQRENEEEPVQMKFALFLCIWQSLNKIALEILKKFSWLNQIPMSNSSMVSYEKWLICFWGGLWRLALVLVDTSSVKLLLDCGVRGGSFVKPRLFPKLCGSRSPTTQLASEPYRSEVL